MLLTARSPLRVSFFGGGTDYPEYFNRSRGAVLGCAINKYIYASALRLSSIIDYRYRVAYSKIETVADVNDIQHPVVREAIKYYDYTDPLDISIMADLPSRSGLGSSSSFTTALIKLLYALKNRNITKIDLAKQAVFIERELLKENVGVQDQFHAAFGGINKFEFSNKRTTITPVEMTTACIEALSTSLFLVFTGITRFASKTLDEQMDKTKSGAIDRDLSHLLTLTDQAMTVLEGEDPDAMMAEFGEMLHDGWETKKKLSSRVSSPEIDALYTAAREAGALGGKLCGAGSGGFLLMLVPPANQPRFLATGPKPVIPISLDTTGTTILSV